MKRERRSALESLAHLVCEVHKRLQLVGLADRTSACEFPLTQTDLADVLGQRAWHDAVSCQQDGG